MNQLQPLSQHDVLYFYLEAQIGASTSKNPKPLGKRGSGQSTRQETRILCASAVESLPMYDICRSRLIEYLQSPDLPDPLLNEFLKGLEESLKANPIYPVMPDADGAKREVKWLTVADVAEDIGVTVDCMRMRINRLKISLPFGSYKFERHWHIHPFDVAYLVEDEE